MASYVVRLNDEKALSFFNKNELEVKKGDLVIVDMDGILESGVVLYCDDADNESKYFIVRKQNEEDFVKNREVLAYEEKDKEIIKERVAHFALDMKLVAVKRSFDNKKILIIYTAEDRVDFRELVRDLAGIFRMRVEMRQIGDREEAKILGGCGMCGQPVCCRRFLSQPKQTTIKMAKAQGQALTPTKINGLCGKLMCCLQYEYDQYKEILDKMPTINSRVSCEDGEGVVAYNDCLSEEVAIKLDKDGSIKKFKLDDLVILQEEKKDEDE